MMSLDLITQRCGLESLLAAAAEDVNSPQSLGKIGEMRHFQFLFFALKQLRMHRVNRFSRLGQLLGSLLEGTDLQNREILLH